MSVEADAVSNANKVFCNICTVGKLIMCPFSRLEPARKEEIIAVGRLEPDLVGVFGLEAPVHLKKGMKSWYSQYPWLTCCEHVGRLFCWICLLFREGQRGGLWSFIGFSDIVRFQICAKRHENSKSHWDSLQGMKTFRRTSQDLERRRVKKKRPSPPRADPIQGGEETVRLLFKRMIDINCVEVLRRANNKNKRKVSSEMLNIVQPFYPTAFQDGELNENITEYLYDMISNKIREDVLESPFFAMIVNTIHDVSHKTIHAVVYRYLSAEGKVLERVLRVTPCAKDGATNFLTTLCSWVDEMDSNAKLVSLSFDGSVKASLQSGTLKHVRIKHNNVLLVHCYNHRLNLILQQAVHSIPPCRSFFQTVAKLTLFFSQSNRRKNAYFTVIGKSKSEPSSFFTTKFLEMLNRNFESVKSLLETMFKYKDEWDGVTSVEARGFYETFNDFDFKFLLSVFSRILPEAENLHVVINRYIFTDHKNCSENIARYISGLMEYNDNFDVFWNELTKPEEGAKARTKHQTPDQTWRDSYKLLYLNIVETVSTQVIQRFADFPSLQFLQLLDTRRFTEFSHNFPEEEFRCLGSELPDLFEMDRLRKQLIDVYRNKDLHKLDTAKLYMFMVDSGRDVMQDQVTKLAALSHVLPLGKVKGTSGMANINSYLVSSRRKLTQKSVVSIEQDLLKQLWKQPTFYDSLMRLTAQANPS